eukprot:scaffold20941_cov143-Skeletonema_marinoi.AAC.6
MSSFPLPGQSLSVMAQIEARKQMQKKSSSDNNNNKNNTSLNTAVSDDSFTSIANRKSSAQQQQFASLDFFPTQLKSMSSDDFDIDHQIVMTDSSTSTFTGLLNSFASLPPDKNNNHRSGGDHAAANYFAQDVENNIITHGNNDDDPTVGDDTMTQFTTEGGEEIVYRSTKKPSSSTRRGDEDDDHRDDDAYETDDYSASVNEDDEESQTEAEEETTVGEFTEAEDDEEDDDDDDDSSVGTAHSGDSFNTLLVEVEHNDVSLREVVIDTTSMDSDTAEDMAQVLQKNTSISTIRLSCKRLECKEGRTRKHHVLSTLLSGIKENTSIESIEIEDTDISHELANSLSQLCARKQSLKNIAMIQCQFIGSGLAILFLGMQHSQSIRNVIFQSCDLGNQGDGGGGLQPPSSSFNVEIIASALPLMNLTSLSLVDVNFPTEECLHYLLENVEHAKELKLLDLSQNKLDERSIALLSKSINRQNQISRLVLSSCSLDNVCMKELAIGLRGYDPLTNLDVSKNKNVGDRGALLIQDLLKGNSKIMNLNVSGCSFSETSLDALEAALRYNNSFLKTFVSVSTGQQIFDVVDALANLGVGGEEDDDDEDEISVEEKRRGRSSKRHGGSRRAKERVKQQQPQSRNPKKSTKSSTSSPSVDRDRGDASSTPPKKDEMRSLFDASFNKRNGNVSLNPQRDVKVHPSLNGQKVPKSPPPPPPPPPPLPKQDFAQSAKESASVRRNETVALPQFFEDQLNFDDKSASHSLQSGAKYASSQRASGNVPKTQHNSSEEFFPSGSGQDFPGSPQYSSYASPRRNSNGPVSMPQYEFSTASSSQSGAFKPTKQDIRSAKYVHQRKSAVQQSPKIDKVIAQLSPSRRDIARSPRSPRSPKGSTGGRGVML